MNRALLKTGTYALMHLTVAIIVAFVLTRSWQVALAVGIIEPMVQTVAFALHERLWSRSAAPGATSALRVTSPCGHGRLWPRRTAETGSGGLA
jgi:uncharacterized membrane protein